MKKKISYFFFLEGGLSQYLLNLFIINTSEMKKKQIEGEIFLKALPSVTVNDYKENLQDTFSIHSVGDDCITVVEVVVV